jgi:DNA-binding NtrC family response regulator
LAASEIDGAFEHAVRCAALSEKSGAALIQRAAYGNLASLSYWLGRFDDAERYYDRAVSVLPSERSDTIVALRGILAETFLAQGRLTECAVLLECIENSAGGPDDQMYYFRHTLAVRAQFEYRTSRVLDALKTADLTFDVAERVDDRLLSTAMALLRAELLFETGATRKAVDVLTAILPRFSNPLHLYGQYERVLGSVLAQTGNEFLAESHLKRSRRIYEGLRHAPGLIALEQSTTALSAPHDVADSDQRRNKHAVDEARIGIQGAAAIMLLVGRPEPLARELVHLLGQAATVRWAAAIRQTSDGTTELLAACGDPAPTEPPTDAPKRIPIGVARDRNIELLIDPKPDIESMATLNAVMLLLATVHDLERARAEREERLTLWPIEDVPTEGGQAVVSGQMRELMAFARRIATTNVSVLLTGESGTGKEILARAIHGFSARAQKPFVPFNCTAVPREMLESQLFGHRRGSFTGADRDHPGLIRAARDGTLFLDEIGELGLDLQPKLLRFLESGEIAPLGEAPLTVDVRIIAATNSDLEQLVRDNRFREDLFYRLNVVRLRIPPLRERRDEIPGLVNYFLGRAAAEFHKGQVRLAEETMEHMLFYRWPGNVRQLQNEIRRIVALADKDTVLRPATLSEDIARARRPVEQHLDGSEVVVSLHQKLLPTLSRIEREMIKAALREHRGRVDAAAKALGISRKGLYLKRQRLGL